MKFAFIYALPGYTQKELHMVETEKSAFYAMAIDYSNKESAIEAARELYEQHHVDMIELCGGLADAHLVSQVKAAVQNKIPVGAVLYGPECRRPLVDLLKL